MVKEIRIYVEGAGRDNPSRSRFRDGMSQFLSSIRDLARSRRIKWGILPCGPRSTAYENFRTALRSHPDAFNILLVDSETVVTGAPWEHLEKLEGWKRLGCSDDQSHLMVHCMEAWIATDPSALAAFYGQGFRQKSLPASTNIETVDKETLLSSLESATRDTQKGPYHKIRHGAVLLGKLDPGRVRLRAGHCDRLFSTLESLIRSA
jgi:Domain of unknown function (DUF4276)